MKKLNAIAVAQSQQTLCGFAQVFVCLLRIFTCYASPMAAVRNSNFRNSNQQNMKWHNRLIVLFGITMLIHSCKCTTEFVAPKNSTSNILSEYRLTCYIQEGAYKEEADKLIVEFHFCSFPNFSPPCSDKKLVNGSVTIVPKFVNENTHLTLDTVYASCYFFTSNNFKQVLQKGNELNVSVTYKVDSLGAIVSREFNHTLTKETKCREHFALH